MPERPYRFVSHWRIAAPRQAVADILLHDEAWAQWWPGLESVESLDDKIGAGARVRCSWRSASGYRLRVVITIVDYRPGQLIAFISEGDLAGDGDFIFSSPQADTTAITIHWNVRTTKPWMNAFGPLLKPLFIANHDKLMAAGEQGLNRYAQQVNRR